MEIRYRHAAQQPLTVLTTGAGFTGGQIDAGATVLSVASIATAAYARITGVARSDRAVTVRIWQGDGTNWDYYTDVALADDGSGVYRAAWSVEIFATHTKVEAINPAGAATTTWHLQANLRSIT